MIAILSLAALMSAYLIASALSPTTAGLASEREQRTMNALREAKAALIAYAANEQWQLYKDPTTFFQPGALPCPDRNNDGNSDGALCANGPLFRIGRLPWKTIGSADLTDATGEQLWYAVSSNFFKSSANVINSDMPGLLTVTGTAASANVVAIVFAPGPPVRDATTSQVQDRSAANINTVGSYLEGFAQVANDWTFTTNALPTETLNDRLVVITQAELMAAVEPVVAARIQRDINPLIQQYRAVWGRYPFAKSFSAGPPANQANYMGTVNQANGLLPITNAPNTFVWPESDITLTLIPAEYTSAPTINSAVCSSGGSATLTCVVDYCCDFDDRPALQISAILSGPTTSFASGPPAAHVGALTMVDRWGNPAGWSSSSPSFPPTTSIVVQPKGLLVTFTGRLWNADTTSGRVTITVPGITSYLPITSSNAGPGGVNPNPNGAWFVANEWYKQTYYAVAPDLLIGGGGNCGATPPCLTVNNFPAPTANKQAILVLAGRSLSSTLRPNGTLADYLEGANLTAANGTNPFVYQHRAGIPTAINDRVVVVAP
jgi:hypothetical protein